MNVTPAWRWVVVRSGVEMYCTVGLGEESNKRIAEGLSVLSSTTSANHNGRCLRVCKTYLMKIRGFEDVPNGDNTQLQAAPPTSKLPRSGLSRRSVDLVPDEQRGKRDSSPPRGSSRYRNSAAIRCGKAVSTTKVRVRYPGYTRVSSVPALDST